jgi:hypothetical protein
MMLEISIPVESGNKAARSGTLGTTLQKILGSLKPESAYFFATDKGERGGYIVFDMQDPSQIPAAAEPFFLALNATLKFQPVMTPDDLGKAMPAIEKAVKEYGG